jgi:predicted DCC family thiol-disulfide oxidoreductase YuxK
VIEGAHVILYDGACALCNRFNRFVQARDRRGAFRFAPLQEPWVKEFLRERGRRAEALDTVYVVRRPERPGAAPELLTRARAVLFVLGELGGPWTWAKCLRLLPERLLDRGYDFVARHRQAWFGPAESCALPSASREGNAGRGR